MKRKSALLALTLTLLLATGTLGPAAAGAVAAKGSAVAATATVTGAELAAAIVQDNDRRQAFYEQAAFRPTDWKRGKVVAKRPYGVVVEADPASAGQPAAYLLQLWRGAAVRVEDDLLTQWDLLTIDAQGAVTDVQLDYVRALPDYFAASSNREFQTLAYAERYPWANLPTDAEARAALIPVVPKDGTMDVYGIAPRDGSVAISGVTGLVRPLATIPAKLGDKPPAAFGERTDAELPMVPTDVTHHWASVPIVELMKRRIVQGYPDRTVRPNQPLTRAELTVLLVRTLRLEAVDPTEPAFADMKSHWADKAARTAREAGLIPAAMAVVSGTGSSIGTGTGNSTGTGTGNGVGGSASFRPGEPVSRLEAGLMLGLAMRTLPLVYRPLPAGAAWPTDLPRLDVEDKQTVELLLAYGIFGADKNGKFRPDDTLTRAEACKILAVFLQLK